MHCPFCQHEDTRVIDSRLAEDGATVRRRRECPGCGERFNTFETAEIKLPAIVKSDGHDGARRSASCRANGSGVRAFAAIRRGHRRRAARITVGRGFDADLLREVVAALGAHLVDTPPDEGQALLFEAFVAARRDPNLAAMLRRRIEDQDARLAKLVEEGKADGTIDPRLATDAVVLFSHAVGLGFLLYGIVERELPSQRDWHEVISRVVAAAAPEVESEG